MDNEHYFIASGSSFLPFPEESIVAWASLSPVRGSRQVEAASPSAEVMRAQVEEITASAHSLAEMAQALILLVGSFRFDESHTDRQTDVFKQIQQLEESWSGKALAGDRRKYADLQTIWSLADTRNIICFHI